MLGQQVLRAGIMDVSGIANIADIADVANIGTDIGIDIADIGTDIADIAIGVTDVVDSVDVADQILQTLRWKCIRCHGGVP